MTSTRLERDGADASAGGAGDERKAVTGLWCRKAFYADHGTYAGATVAALRAIDTGLNPTVKLSWVEMGRYCLESTVDGQTATVTGARWRDRVRWLLNDRSFLTGLPAAAADGEVASPKSVGPLPHGSLY